MSPAVFVLGGAQTDFAIKAPDGDVFELIRAATFGALDAAAVDADEIEVSHVGNFVGELFNFQGQMGGLVAAVDPGLANKPASRHEAACASGSMAVLAAMADLESGRYDLALVVGAEVLRNVPAPEAGLRLGCAGWAGRELVDEPLPWPASFAQMAEEYDNRYGLQHAHLGRIAEINTTNARRNPHAQTRHWSFEWTDFYDSDANPRVAGMLRKLDCSRPTDGAAAVVLASERFVAQWARRRAVALESVPRILGWGHRTATMLLEDKLRASRDSEYLFPHMRAAILDAYGRAGIAGSDQLDVIETHDCFSISEYIAIDHLGITSPGKAWQAIDDGVIEAGGALPVNPSGGLIGLGHPVGATGVRMVLDAAKQVTGSAGDYQVEGARRAATLNIGGSATTVASFVVGV